MRLERSLAVVLFVVTSIVGITIPLHAEDGWPASVPGWQVPQAGEHPRLLFRRADIPELRRRAATPEGRAMLEHLKKLLGGGEALPSVWPDDPPTNYVSETAVKKWPVGAFTLSHPVGFGFLYVLSGDTRYAELARQCLDKIFEGQVDRDSRHSWTSPGTGFRLSFVLQSICLTYDFCASAWPVEYRRHVTEQVMNLRAKKVDKNKFYTLETLANADGYPPTSNHFGAYLLGPGLVALTFRGEPGADDARLNRVLETVETNLKRVLGQGFGDYGWHAEGISCGRIAANYGVLPLLQSLRIAAGRDYISPRPVGRATVLRLMHEIVPTGERVDERGRKRITVPSVPMIPHRGDYGSNLLYERPIISHMGDFALGMGAVLPREAEAMAWIYDHFVESGPEKTWNSGPYPHLLVYAFVNWPRRMTPPDEVFPKVIADEVFGYYAARNGWRGPDDVLVTTYLKRGPSGYKSGPVSTGTYVWGLRERFTFGGLRGRTRHFRAGVDGSMELADENGNALVVDFSGPVPVIAATGRHDVNRNRVRTTTVEVGGQAITVATLSTGDHPVPSVQETAIRVGDQTIQWADGRLLLSRFRDRR